MPLDKITTKDLIRELKICIDENGLPLYLKGFLDTLVDENKELKRLNKNLKNSKIHLRTFNRKLKQENEILKMNVKDTYDTGQDIIGELTQENEKLKKFVLHFKRVIKEGLSADYRHGENIIFDSLLNEFGKRYLKELLEVLG